MRPGSLGTTGTETFPGHHRMEAQDSVGSSTFKKVHIPYWASPNSLLQSVSCCRKRHRKTHFHQIQPNWRWISYRSPIQPPKGLTICACGFQTLVHGASAGGEGDLLRRTSVGAVPLTAITLEAIQRQVFKLHDLGEDKRLRH